MEGQLSVRPAVSQASIRLYSKTNVCKNYHVVCEFETTISAGLCTVSGRGGRLFKLSLNLNILTYLLTPSSKVLLEKLTGSAASQEIPRVFRTRRFITVLISGRHLPLS